MKKTNTQLNTLLIILFLLPIYSLSQQNVGIGTNTPDSSAKLDINANDKGILIPRLTTAQRIAIASPANGLMLYDTDTKSFWYYDGTNWADFSAKNGWSLKGNTVTDSNFIGTNNKKPLIVKVNKQRVGYLDTDDNIFWGKDAGTNNLGAGNFAVGSQALNSNTTGFSNIAIGAGALNKNTILSNLVAIGDSALYNNGIGATYDYDGTDNTAIGRKTLYANTTGYANIAIGSQSLLNNTSGGYNVAIGYQSLLNNTLGNGNIANGYQTLYSNTTGSYNVANGTQSLYLDETGGYNTANGFQTLYSNTDGRYNSANGFQSLYSNSTGRYNSATGASSLYSNTTGFYNVANGINALYSNTIGGDNVANGSFALYSNTDGLSNVANGYQSLYSNTTGDNNIATGNQSLYFNTTADNNVAYGSHSLYSNTTGMYNVAIGHYTLYLNTTGENNVANGNGALSSNTTGYNNTANGNGSLSFNSTGYFNVAIGNTSLSYNTTGFFNTAIGALADVTSGSLTNATAIGYLARVNASNKVRIGNTSVTVIEGQVAYSFPSDARFKYNIKNDVPGLAFIKKLQPVTYYFDEEKLDEFTKTGVVNNSIIHPVGYNGEKEIHTGFLAQDVEKIANELGYHFDGVRTPANDKDHYSLAYSQFIMPLVKAVQEQQVLIVKQDEKILQLQSFIDKQNLINKELENLIKKIEEKIK